MFASLPDHFLKFLILLAGLVRHANLLHGRFVNSEGRPKPVLRECQSCGKRKRVSDDEADRFVSCRDCQLRELRATTGIKRFGSVVTDDQFARVFRLTPSKRQQVNTQHFLPFKDLTEPRMRSPPWPRKLRRMKLVLRSQNRQLKLRNWTTSWLERWQRSIRTTTSSGNGLPGLEQQWR